MHVRVISGREIGPVETRRWEELLRQNADLASPYFRPEFTQAVAAVCDDTRVAILEEGGAIIGFFPFQRGRFAIGKPIGRTFSDYQAVIAARGTALDPAEIVGQAGLAVWEFDHLLAAQQAFSAFHQRLAESPVLDLSGGFEAYLGKRRHAGAERIGQIQRKARKLEREIGDVELVVHRADHALLDHVIRAKSEQCRRTGVRDFFGQLPWTVPLVRRILDTQTPGFSGMLSVLYAGGKIAAAHFGMRSQRVLHWWFPVYDPDDPVAKYSPGGILLLELAERVASDGIHVLDLGKGDDAYKSSFMTGAIPIAEGAVEIPSLPATLRRTRIRSEQWLRRSPLTAPLRHGVRALRRLKRWYSV